MDEIVVAIGSAQYSGTTDNPFDLETRRQMIASALDLENIKYTIAAVPDIHDETRWAEHLVKITGPVDVVYTGNELVSRLFKEKKYPVKPVKIKLKISGTNIRALMARLDSDWKNLVPSSVVSYISNWRDPTLPSP